MKNFWNYFGGTILKPNSTFELLLSDSRQLSQGAKSVFLMGILYTLTVIGLAIVQADIMAPAWILVPEDEYYFWEIFFALPVVVLSWVLASGLIQLSGKIFRAKGSFENTAAVMGFALSVPYLATWIPETIGAGLFVSGVLTQEEWIDVASKPGFWNMFALTYQLVAVAWFIALIWIGVQKAQKMHWLMAGIVTLGTVLVVGSLMLVFIR